MGLTTSFSWNFRGNDVSCQEQRFFLCWKDQLFLLLQPAVPQKSTMVVTRSQSKRQLAAAAQPEQQKRRRISLDDETDTQNAQSESTLPISNAKELLELLKLSESILYATGEQNEDDKRLIANDVRTILQRIRPEHWLPASVEELASKPFDIETDGSDAVSISNRIQQLGLRLSENHSIATHELLQIGNRAKNLYRELYGCYPKKISRIINNLPKYVCYYKEEDLEDVVDPAIYAVLSKQNLIDEIEEDDDDFFEGAA